MAGTIPSVSLSMQFDNATGKQLKAGKLYSYAADTTTVQKLFRDSGLTLQHEWPLPLDGAGRLAEFYCADGAIRLRLVNAAGVVQFDQPHMLVVGPSSGGGGVDTTDPNSIATTGDWKFKMNSGALAGWVRANGRTVGSATSGGTERANADTQALFTYLWDFADSIAPVIGGRGANAAADFAANKAITLPDCRFRSPFGLDDMGNSAAGRSTGALFFNPGGGAETATTPGGRGGAAAHALTSAENGPHTHTASVTDPGHTHPNSTPSSTVSTPPGGTPASNAGFTNSGSATTGISVTVNSSGSGTAHNNMPGFLLGTWYIRL